MWGWNKALLCDSALRQPLSSNAWTDPSQAKFWGWLLRVSKMTWRRVCEGSAGSRRGCGRTSWAGTPLDFILCDRGQSVVLYCSLKYGIDFGTVRRFLLVRNVPLCLQHHVSLWAVCCCKWQQQRWTSSSSAFSAAFWNWDRTFVVLLWGCYCALEHGRISREVQSLNYAVSFQVSPFPSPEWFLSQLFSNTWDISGYRLWVLSPAIDTNGKATTRGQKPRGHP